LQFPRRAPAKVFGRLAVAGYQLPHELSCGVSVLADEQDTAVVKNRQHYDGTMVSHNFANYPYSRRLD
jgi:hypothetical protein